MRLRWKPLLLFLFVSCSLTNPSAVLTVHIKNATTHDIVVMPISGAVTTAETRTLSAQTETILKGSRLGDVTFMVGYQERKYRVTSGYTDDFSAYEIRFYDDGAFSCQLLHGSDVPRTITLTELL